MLQEKSKAQDDEQVIMQGGASQERIRTGQNEIQIVRESQRRIREQCIQEMVNKW